MELIEINYRKPRVKLDFYDSWTKIGIMNGMDREVVAKIIAAIKKENYSQKKEKLLLKL